MALTKVGKEGIAGISNSSDATAITISSGEVVTLADDLIIKDSGTIGSASKTDAITIAASGNTQLRSTGIAAGSQLFQIIDDGTTVLNVRSEDGNINFPVAGGGVYLGVTAAASSNLLNDYEEGTFTPTATNATGYVSQAGHYTKVGNQVTCVFNVEISGVSSNGNQVLGLPFTPALSSGQSSGYVGVMYFANLANNFISLGGYVVHGQNKINFSGAASAASTIQFNAVNVWSQNGSRILATVTYLVA